MAIGARIVQIWENSKNTFVSSKDLELIYKSVSVSADGNDNGLDITEDSGAFDFNSKNFVSVGTINGVNVASHAARHIQGGADEINGDQLDIDFNPTFYTPATVAEAGDVDMLSAHLKGIDDKLGTLSNADGLDVKFSVRATTTQKLADEASIDSALAYDNDGGASLRGQITAVLSVADELIIDGVELVTGDRVLLRHESTGLGADANGIYVVTTDGTDLTLDRAADFDEDDEVTANAFTFVEEGTLFADCGFVLVTDNPITLGGASGTDLAFTQYSFAGVIDASDGLLKTGNLLSVKPDVSETMTTLASAINVSANGVSVKVDDATIEGSGQGAAGSESLRVKALGIGTGHLAATSVTAAKLGNDVAGDGLTGGNGAAIAALSDATGGANLAKSINVSANGLAVKVDDATIEEGASARLRVKAAGINENHIAASALGDGLKGGSGVALAVQYAQSYTNNTGSTIAANQLVFINEVAGEIELADADDVDAPNFLLGYTMESIADAASGYVAVRPGAPLAGFTGLTQGAPVYVSSTAGGYTQTAPSGTGKSVYILGRATSATTVCYDPKFVGQYA